MHPALAPASALPSPSVQPVPVPRSPLPPDKMAFHSPWEGSVPMPAVVYTAAASPKLLPLPPAASPLVYTCLLPPAAALSQSCALSALPAKIPLIATVALVPKQLFPASPWIPPVMPVLLDRKVLSPTRGGLFPALAVTHVTNALPMPSPTPPGLLYAPPLLPASAGAAMPPPFLPATVKSLPSTHVLPAIAAMIAYLPQPISPASAPRPPPWPNISRSSLHSARSTPVVPQGASDAATKLTTPTSPVPFIQKPATMTTPASAILNAIRNICASLHRHTWKMQTILQAF
ncbi:hypothetical protein AX14_005624 [Amanita brunnescens Koide BX004]|nr:hypothetical protein AX14_005624 [Amanita brunnescens Koide BX004]